MINLKDVELLSSLTWDEISFLESISQKRSLKTWEILFNKWDEATALYILLEWKLEAYLDNQEEEIILWEIKAEDIVWEMWLLSEKKLRTASIRAIENSILLIILPFAIDNLKQNHPEIIWKISNIIEKRKRDNELKEIDV